MTRQRRKVRDRISDDTGNVSLACPECGKRLAIVARTHGGQMIYTGATLEHTHDGTAAIWTCQGRCTWSHEYDFADILFYAASTQPGDHNAGRTVLPMPCECVSSASEPTPGHRRTVRA